MPQMMPMYWMILMLFMSFIIMSITSFLYFFLMNFNLKFFFSTSPSKKWIWKW